MPHVRFKIESNCETEEPSRILCEIQADVFESEEGTDESLKIGTIFALLILRGRAMNEGESLYEAMDSYDDELFECYQALFEMRTDEWSKAVTRTYQTGLDGLDVLFIEGIELATAHRGKGIAAQVLREIINIFGWSCGLVVCRPSSLEFDDESCEDAQVTNTEEGPSLERGRSVGPPRFVQFWEQMGFRKLSDSDFYTFAPQLTRQPNPISATPVASRNEAASKWVN